MPSRGRSARGAENLMHVYYARRAREYESVYDKPERQGDLRRLEKALQELLAGHDVLEVACGTGFWTQRAAMTARSVLGVDIGREVLEIAAGKAYPRGEVRFVRADAYRLEGIDGTFSAALAAFWWSHVPLSRLDEFVRSLHRCLGEGRRVVLVDNRHVDGSSTPIARVDRSGNSYQRRRLDDGAEFEILKNFPAPADIRSSLAGVSRCMRIVELDHYWYAVYDTAASAISARAPPGRGPAND